MVKIDHLSTSKKATLGDYAVGRDNNFNLLRVLAAIMVVINHSDALATGTPTPTLLKKYTGMDCGNIAVDIFFVTSGFLVMASLEKRSLANYFSARLLRILPALAASIVLCAFLVGPTFTKESFPAYFCDSHVWYFVAKNISLLSGPAFSLPGVFGTNPLPNVVNGSLWTLPWEARLYTLLGFLAYTTRYTPIKCLINLRTLALFTTFLVVTLHVVNFYCPVVSKEGMRVVSAFFLGSTFYWLRSAIPLNRQYLLLAFGLLALTAAINKSLFFLSYTAVLPYLVFGIAYLPGGFIRRFNNFGDYSYGIYIYSFPIQQSLVAIANPTPLELSIYSLAIVFPLAALSWHYLENKILQNFRRT
jgi:peptidoglycan/LPS O-acetylase OafA/YrhL